MDFIYDYFTTNSIFNIFMTFIYVINFFIATAIIFLERRDANSTLAWLVVLFAIPVVGIVLYLLFSQNIARFKLFKSSQEEEDVITNAIEQQKKDIDNGTFHFRGPVGKRWSEVIALNQSYGEGFYTQDNEVKILVSGRQMMSAMLKDIGKAKKSINIMFFIVKNDGIGRMLIEALTRKAEEGVKVRFLVDSLGSRQISPRVVKGLTDAGGEFETFFPPKVRHLNVNFNYRNHRKVVVIDDEIGYVGGYNIAREYLDLKKKFGHWRDTHLRVTGSAVKALNSRFRMDWRSTSKKHANEMFDTDFNFKEENSLGIGMQITSCGPDVKDERIKKAFMKMISLAKKSIYIQTPYFVPDAAVLESIIIAARSGVKVKIMIPCMPDHVFVYWATYSYVGEILKNGGEIYIYDGGFLHAKVLMVDGEVSTVGSTNFDRRSFRLNFECNAFLYSTEFSKRLEAEFEKDLKSCHQLTQELYDNRSIWIKIKESISRLLSDIL